MATSNVKSSKPTSRRGYLSQEELAQFANITIEDETEANDVISQAEEMIDAWIGQREKNKFLDGEVEGIATSGGSDYLIDSSDDTPIDEYDNFFTYCEIEIIGGTSQGDRRRITASYEDSNKIEVADNFSEPIDSTSAYVIRQLGIFPRDNSGTNSDVRKIDDTYYKRIPEAVRRAVAAQVEYIIEKGDSFFKGGADFHAEQIGDYSYERNNSAVGKSAMIAPKARMLLKGFKRRIGKMIGPNPTKL